jgi:hypothetical protein
MSAQEKTRLNMQYRRQAVAALSPREKLLLTYDLALTAANAGDMNRLLQLLILLRKAIDFNADPLIALHFLTLYRHCERVLDQRQDFAEVANVMFTLKRALTIAKERPMTDEALAERERMRKAISCGMPFFGRRGKHYGPKARKVVAKPPKGKSQAEDKIIHPQITQINADFKNKKIN